MRGTEQAHTRHLWSRRLINRPRVATRVFHRWAAGVARTPEQAPLWGPGMWPQQALWGPPAIQATFDGSPDRVALFLSQIISHMDLYGRFYPSQWEMVMALTAVLTGKAADWVADLHSYHTRELADMGHFLEAVRFRFEDESCAQRGELVALKQKGRSAKEYAHEFHKISGRLQAWPERLLVHQFCTGLDRDLQQACVYWGLPPHLTD